MVKGKFWLLGLIVLLESGCAAQQSYDHSEPRWQEVGNHRTVDAPFDQTWDKLVKSLSADFFSINNIEKASRIINVSFSTQNPQEFVDCGFTRRSYTSPTGRQESFAYKSEDDSQYKTADDSGRPFLITRRTKLSGRINIYVAPADDKTEISVNARYVLDIKITYQAMNNYEKIVGAPFTENAVVNFDTKKPSRTEGNRPGCTSRGKLEERILRAAT